VNVNKLKLLFALQDDPMAPAATLARKVGITPPTARAWLEDLQRKRVYGGVHANLRARRIGLELDDFILRVDSYDSLLKVEQFCEEHPYTSYRARVFGGEKQGIMLQFRQPEEAKTHLLTAFDEMERQGLVREVREIPTLAAEYGSKYTRPKFSAWDEERMAWRFDWKKWWNRRLRQANSDQTDTTSFKPLSLDMMDAKLLEQITRNARRKNTEIIEAMGYRKDEPGIQQKVSSRLKVLERKVVEEYRVFIEWFHFDVYNTPFIMARADEEVTDNLIRRLSQGGFPFGSSIRKTRNGFVWSARLPAAHVSELIALVWSIAKSYEVLMIDYKHSVVYGLWSEAFDEDTRWWKTSKSFCCDEPLKAIGLA